MEEEAIRPQARRYARFVPQLSASSADPTITWLFRATLRDGSTFAIDVCNAQYTASTVEDTHCGVFPWDQYMERLRVEVGGAFVGLGFCATRRTRTDMTGTVEDVASGIFTAADKQTVAEVLAMSIIAVVSMALTHSTKGLTMAKLVGLPSSDYVTGVQHFRFCLQECLKFARERIEAGDAQGMLLSRFEAGLWTGV